jgi:hypothetical protein
MLRGIALVKYREIFENLYDNDNKISRVLSDAGINQALVDLGGDAKAKWHSIIKVAYDENRLGSLLSVVQKDYGMNLEVAGLYHSYHQQQKLLALIKNNNITWDKLLGRYARSERPGP